jgi:hypothetical protein
VGISKKRPPGDSPKVRRRYIAQGANAPHDGLAVVPVPLDDGRYKGVTGVQMAHMRPVLPPVM